MPTMNLNLKFLTEHFTTKILDENGHSWWKASVQTIYNTPRWSCHHEHSFPVLAIECLLTTHAFHFIESNRWEIHEVVEENKQLLKDAGIL